MSATVAARNRLPLFALLGANAVSMLGNVLSLIAIPWFVLETTGSASKTGLTGFAAALPFIIAGIFGGAIVDRLGFRRMSIVSDLASSVCVALIPLLHATVGLAFWQLLVLVFLGGLLDTPGTTARGSLLPELSERAGMRLERTNAFEQMISRGAFLFGAPLAGIIIAATGIGAALWIDAASFIVSASIVAMLIPNILVERSESAASNRYLDELREGFAFIRNDPLTLPLVGSVALMNFLDAMTGLVMPVYAERIFGRAFDFGVMVAAAGGGAVVTTILFAAIGHRLPRRTTYILAFILASAPLLVLTATPGLIVVAAAMVVRGLGAGPLNPILMTVSQERIPVELRGRVFGVISGISWLAIPVGRLIAGYLVEWFGLIPTITALGIGSLVITTSMFLIPALKLMEHPELKMQSYVNGNSNSMDYEQPQATVAAAKR
jgi:MFS family permease